MDHSAGHQGDGTMDDASFSMTADAPEVPVLPEHLELAAAVRELIDACVLTEAPADVVDTVAVAARALARELRVVQLDEPRWLAAARNGMTDDTGTPTVGRRNPVAPPLEVEYSAEQGRVWTDFSLGAPYEGPPGNIHGGIVALVLDDIMASVPWLTNQAAVTARLDFTYLRPCPLNQPLRCEATVDHTEGRKIHVTGQITDATGEPTVTATGLFIVQRS